METCAYCNALDGDPLVVMEQAIREGCQVLFTTSPRLLPSSLRAAVDHPEALILNCSLNTSHRYIRTYYARMYEVKFISGAIAGALAGGDSIGYGGGLPHFRPGGLHQRLRSGGPADQPPHPGLSGVGPPYPAGSRRSSV